MTGVVANSTSHLSDDDLNAVAVYLKSLALGGDLSPDPHRSDAAAVKLAAATGLTLGERLYLDNCGACHFVKGKGAPGYFPSSMARRS